MSAGTATLAIIVALALGFGGGWLYKKGTTPTTTTTTTTTPTTTIPTTTTSTLPQALACSGSVLSGSVGTSGGAAGTIQMTFNVSNIGATTCSIHGYPTVKLLDANMIVMTGLTIQGNAVFQPAGANAAPKVQHVTAGGSVEFVLQFSDVPSGTERTCPQSASVNVYPPGSATSFNVVTAIAPCNSGTMNVSPFFGATRQLP
jgi:hypothetical protein